MATGTKEKSKKGKVEKSEKPAKSAAPATVEGSQQLVVPIDSIVMPSKNLIVRTDVGSLDSMKASLKQNGQIHNLVCRPGKKAGTYELLSGHRRYAAMREIGSKKFGTVKIDLRTNLSEDLDALGLIMSENSDSRTEPAPTDQARVFDRMCKDLGDDKNSATEVAKRCGYSPEYVRRMRRILSAPKVVLESLNDGTIPKQVALSFMQIDDPNVSKRAAKAIGEGAIKTEAELKEFQVEVAREIREKGGEVASKSADKRKSGAVAKAWRGKRDINDAYDAMLWEYGVASGEIDDEAPEYKDIKDDKDAAATIAERLAVFAWLVGGTDEIDPESKTFKKFIDSEIGRVVELYGEDESEETEEEEKPAKGKKSAKAKASKEDEETEESEDEESEDSEDEETEESEDEESEDSEDEETEESEDEESEDSEDEETEESEDSEDEETEESEDEESDDE